MQLCFNLEEAEFCKMRELAYAESDVKFFQSPPQNHVEVSDEFAAAILASKLKSSKLKNKIIIILGQHGRALKGLSVGYKRKLEEA